MSFRLRTLMPLGALAATCAWAQLVVFFQPRDERVQIMVGGRLFANFYFGKEWPQPFMHPLSAASGTAVTRGYPVEKIEGESQDHNWHHGLWYAHGDINGVDFWRDKGPEATGRIVLKNPTVITRDAVWGDFSLITPAKKNIGTMRQAFRVVGTGEIRTVDVRVRISADQGVALKFGDTEEGALGLRLRDEFREDRGAVLTNSDRLTGTKDIWGKRAKWVDYSTTIGKEKVGVTILDHPANPKHPTFWHARGYGLCAANPFGEHDFMQDKTRDGSLTVPVGGSVTFLYRVVIHPGGSDPDQADQWFGSFAKEK